MFKKISYILLFVFSPMLAQADSIPSVQQLDILKLRTCAEQGNPQCQQELGSRYFTGTDIDFNDSLAFKWFLLAAEQGLPVAEYQVGQYYRHGWGVQQNDSLATIWYSRSSEQGYAPAWAALHPDTMELINDDKTSDPIGQVGLNTNKREAVNGYRILAEQNHPIAQYNLGVCYATGRGVQKNIDSALVWMKRAAEMGQVEAQLYIALNYLYRQFDFLQKNNIQPDSIDKIALHYLRMAVAQKSPLAQFTLAKCYAEWRGVEKNESSSVEWYEKAATQGYLPAQYNLAVCYEEGRGVKKNMKQALYWYQKAADQGDPWAKRIVKKAQKHKF